MTSNNNNGNDEHPILMALLRLASGMFIGFIALNIIRVGVLLALR